MRVSLDGLASFSRMGDEGGAKAADALEALTGEPAYTALTRTAVVDAYALDSLLGGAETRVTVSFGGALSGTAFIFFDEAFAAHVTDCVATAGDPLPEVANILTSGFVDVWAAEADDTVDVEPPERADGDATPVSVDALADGYAFAFECRLSTAAADGDCRFAVLPDVDPFLDYLAGDGEPRLTSEELDAYIRLTEESAGAVASHVGAMTGHDATVAESHFDLVPVERVPTLLDDGAYSGAVFECDGPVELVLAVLFDEDEPGAVGEAMLPGFDLDPDLAASATAELGNVTASGVLDGWANRLDATIDISASSRVHDHGRAVLDTVAAAYGQHADAVAVVDTVVDVSDDITCRVCAVPSPEDADVLGEFGKRLTEDQT